jgi:hypothetical protein
MAKCYPCLWQVSQLSANKRHHFFTTYFSFIYIYSTVIIGEAGEIYTEIWGRDLTERDCLEDLSTDGKIILKWVFKKWDVDARTRSIWLSIRTGNRCL